MVVCMVKRMVNFMVVTKIMEFEGWNEIEQSKEKSLRQIVE
jgi:hypothetical protein